MRRAETEPACGLSSRVRGWVLGAVMRLAAMLIVGICAIALMRFGPGFETDDRDLDATLSAETRRSLHEQHRAEVRTFLSGAVRGDFGTSKALGIPVRDLITDRGGATLRILLAGAALAWTCGFAWAFFLAVVRIPWLDRISTVANASLLCLPAAAIAALLMYLECPAYLVLAVALVPKVFQVTRALVAEAIQHPEVLAARVRGIRTPRILAAYVLPRIGRPLLAWFAATAGMAIGAVVPIEVICDVPGLGQLAWKAALARDLPVLVTLTLMVAIVIQISNAASAVASQRMEGVRA